MRLFAFCALSALSVAAGGSAYAAEPTPGASAWECVPGDDVACSAKTHRRCSPSGTWLACETGSPESLAHARMFEPKVAEYEHLAPALDSIGGVVFVVGVVAVFGFALLPYALLANDGQGDSTLTAISIATGSSGVGAMLLGGSMQYIGSIYTPVLSPLKRTAGLKIMPYFGPGGAGLHGTF